MTALLGTGVLALLLAAQTTLACTDRVAVSMPAGMMAAMPGMDMSSATSGSMDQPEMMICPVVLALLVACAVLTASAIAMLWRDPHRALTQRAIVCALAELPPVRTIGILALGGGCAVAAMLWLERSGPPVLPVCALLAGLLVACSLSATIVTILTGRVALALGRRLILAIVAAIVAVTGNAAPRVQRFLNAVVDGHAVPLLAAGRGLRAPPPFVR